MSSDSFKISDRKDILLALLGEGNEPVVGITRLVKLLFLLQQEADVTAILDKGDKDYYGYQPWKMGPFSMDVYEDVELLEDCGLIKGQSEDRFDPDEEAELSTVLAVCDDPQQDDCDIESLRRFCLTPDGMELAEQFLNYLSQKHPAQRQKLRELKAKYNRMPLRGLLRYVYSRYPEMTSKSIIKDQLGL